MYFKIHLKTCGFQIRFKDIVKRWWKRMLGRVFNHSLYEYRQATGLKTHTFYNSKKYLGVTDGVAVLFFKGKKVWAQVLDDGEIDPSDGL